MIASNVRSLTSRLGPSMSNQNTDWPKTLFGEGSFPPSREPEPNIPMNPSFPCISRPQTLPLLLGICLLFQHWTAIFLLLCHCSQILYLLLCLALALVHDEFGTFPLLFSGASHLFEGLAHTDVSGTGFTTT